MASVDLALNKSLRIKFEKAIKNSYYSPNFVAKKLGISQSMIAMWMRNERNISNTTNIAKIESFCELFKEEVKFY